MYKRLNLKSAVTAALLSAMSIVLGKFLQIPIGISIRISFESLPIILSSVLLGPVFGLLSGLVADLIGCLIAGYSVNPIITIGCSLMGVLPYLFMRKRSPKFIFVAVILSHIICSMIIKTFGIIFYYGGGWGVVWSRVAVYAVIAPVEAYLVYLISKSIGKRFRNDLQ